MPADTDPGPPEERTEDGTVLTGRSEKEGKKNVSDVWHSTDSMTFLVEVVAAYAFPPETTVGILASTSCLASGEDMYFSTRTR